MQGSPLFESKVCVYKNSSSPFFPFSLSSSLPTHFLKTLSQTFSFSSKHFTLNMDAVKNAANTVSDKVTEATSGAQKEGNKAVA